MNVFRATSLPLLLVTGAFAAEEVGTSLPKFSPFEARGNAAAAAPAANENFEFAAIFTVGGRTDLVFYDKTAKKSHWIGVGETKEGIAVLNYDSRREHVVIRVNGVEKTLPLRKARGPVAPVLGVSAVPTGFNVPPPVVQPASSTPAFTAAAMPGPTPAPSQAGPDSALNAKISQATVPPTPEVQVKQETEARMLVSDLLEIGMAQRKAYEDAQRKAAEGNAQPPAGQETPPPAAPIKPN